MEDRKHKIGGSQAGSSSHPRYLGNPPQQFKQGHPQGHQHQHQRQHQQQYQRQFPQQQQQYHQNNQHGGNQYQRQNNQAPRLLPQQPTRITKQLQCKEEAVHVSIVRNKTNGRNTAQRRQLSSRQLSTLQQDREHHNKHQEAVARPTTVER
jgi:hypothetical protein